MNKFWKWLYLPVGISLSYAFHTDHPNKMLLFAMGLAPVLGIWLAKQGLLDNFKLDENIRYSMITFAVLIAFLANPTGSINANKIRNSKTENKALIDGNQYSYIGKLGGSIFLYLKQDGKVIQMNPIPKYIEYIPNPSPNPTA